MKVVRTEKHKCRNKANLLVATQSHQNQHLGLHHFRRALSGLSPLLSHHWLCCVVLPFHGCGDQTRQSKANGGILVAPWFSATRRLRVALRNAHFCCNALYLVESLGALLDTAIPEHYYMVQHGARLLGGGRYAILSA